MSARGGLILATNATGAAATSPVVWVGGRTAIVINATTYPSTCSLQCQGPSGAWININGSAYSADQVTVYDLPQGQYRMNLSGGTVAALYANLVSIPYT